MKEELRVHVGVTDLVARLKGVRVGHRLLKVSKLPEAGRGMTQHRPSPISHLSLPLALRVPSLLPHPTCLALTTTLHFQCPSRSPPSMQPAVGDPRVQG